MVTEIACCKVYHQIHIAHSLTVPSNGESFWGWDCAKFVSQHSQLASKRLQEVRVEFLRKTTFTRPGVVSKNECSGGKKTKFFQPLD